MKKKVYRVRTQYIFEGVFEVVAESKEDARQKVLQDCGLVMGGSIHSTLSDDEINSILNETKSHANFRFAWLLFFVFEQAGDQSKEAKESRKNSLIHSTILNPLFFLQD